MSIRCYCIGVIDTLIWYSVKKSKLALPYTFMFRFNFTVFAKSTIIIIINVMKANYIVWWLRFEAQLLRYLVRDQALSLHCFLRETSLHFIFLPRRKKWVAATHCLGLKPMSETLYWIRIHPGLRGNYLLASCKSKLPP